MANQHTAVKLSKGKPRSPDTPSRLLMACLEDARKLYAKYSHGTFKRPEIASVLEVSSSSGSFAQRLFSIKAYGLLETVGTDYKVSGLFLQIEASERGSAGFRKSALEAMKRSPVFADLLDQFQDKLPDRKTLSIRLETQMKFNHERAQETAVILHESLRSIGVLDPNGNILPIRGEQLQADTDQHPAGSAGDGAKVGLADRFRLDVPLQGGERATVFLPPHWTGADAQRIGKVLEAAAPG